MGRLSDRIALFLPDLGGGGAERVTLTLAEGLAERGYPLDLVVAEARGALANEVPTAVRLIDLGAPKVVASLPALVAYLRRCRPRVMLSALSHANCVALWARGLARVKTRLIVAEHAALSQVTAHSTSVRSQLLPVLMRWSYRYADGIVAVSNGVADDLATELRIARGQIRVIHNPIVTPALLRKAVEPLDHPWYEVGQPPVILGVGRLAAEKDFSTLIRAFARVRRSRAARLMILGDGEERASLESLVRELNLEQDVALPGFTDNPYPYMKRSAAFVLSSRWEGLPTVLVEAMACDTPVVATDCPFGPAEILENGRWGRLVPIGEPVALADSILQTLNQPVPEIATRAMCFSAGYACERYLDALMLPSVAGIESGASRYGART